MYHINTYCLQRKETVGGKQQRNREVQCYVWNNLARFQKCDINLFANPENITHGIQDGPYHFNSIYSFRR